jgi:phosphoribosylanthranilate isomerase
MKQGIVKLCGIRTPSDAQAAAEAGADLVGLVFAPSKRQVTLSAARAIVDALASLPTRPRVVGLFVNAPVSQVHALADAVPLDCIQLCGEEPPSYLDLLDRPVLRSLPLGPRTSPNEARALSTAYFERRRPPLALVVDALVPGHYGGTGAVANWELAAELAREFSLLLAGGLHPGNVARAIEIVQPAGVDVSSGIERDGQKDPDLMRSFVESARAAFATLTGSRTSLPDARPRATAWKEEP